jgi:hypothetical protein
MKYKREYSRIEMRATHIMFSLCQTLAAGTTEIDCALDGTAFNGVQYDGGMTGIQSKNCGTSSFFRRHNLPADPKVPCGLLSAR